MIARVLAMTAALVGVMTIDAARAETQLERGHYLAVIMDCGGCHTTGALIGKPEPGHMLAGSTVGWAIPGLGVVYPRNITPDKVSGIGTWSSADIVRLLRTGARPDGREIAGPMPWRAYAALTDADMAALVAYLQSVPAVDHPTPGPTPMAEVKGPYFTVAVQ